MADDRSGNPRAELAFEINIEEWPVEEQEPVLAADPLDVVAVQQLVAHR